VKQVIQSVREGTVEVVEVPPPERQQGAVLVRVASSLVSAGTERSAVDFGSRSLLGKARSKPHLVQQVAEMALRDGIIPTYRTVSGRLDTANLLGYSCAGTVIEVSEEDTRLKPGDRVACAGAGYASHAEIVSVPKNLTVKVPEGDDRLLEEAAFTTLGAIALQGVRLGNPQIGERIAVIGLGLLGQILVRILSASGCRAMGYDPNHGRAELASQRLQGRVSTSAAAFASICEQETDGNGADLTLITAATPSNEPVELAGQVTRAKGRVVAVGDVGLRIPRREFYHKEIEFVVSRSYGPGRYDRTYEELGNDYPYPYVRWTEQRNMQAFVELLAEDKLGLADLVSHRFPIDEASRAYELIAGTVKEPYLGVLLQYSGVANVQRVVRVENRKVARKPTKGAVGIGVIGAGAFVSSTLLPALRNAPDVEFVGIANRTGGTAKKVAERFGFAYAASGIDDVIGDPSVHLVVIGTPHNMHASQVISALSAGKHILVEKPLCLSFDELAKIDEAVRRSPGTMLMVGVNRRFARLTRALTPYLEEKTEPLTVTYRVNAGFIPHDHWVQDPKVGGGRLLGEGIHFLDWICGVAGSRATQVSAVGMEDAGKYTGDNFVVQISFENGSVGNLVYVANGARRAGKERVEVTCSGTTCVLDDFRKLEVFQPGRFFPKRTKLRSVDKGHAEECRLVVEAARTGGDSPVSFADLRHSTVLCLSAKKSLELGAPVKIAADDTGAI
jgi:predicted dehydrogenase/threonine dehydrogenase-like Zn-dependent dehydrogenase